TAGLRRGGVVLLAAGPPTVRAGVTLSPCRRAVAVGPAAADNAHTGHHREKAMTTLRVRLLSFLVLLPLVCATGADWPGFRGPQGTGGSPEAGPPVRWGPKDNLAWKTRLPGPGASSPIVWGDRVFVTCYTGYGKSKSDPGDMSQLRRHLVCLDRPSGKILWQADSTPKLPEVEWRNIVN